MRRRNLSDTRQRILAAAEELSYEAGPARLSLEAVAARAGVSKGGLLYHFPSKHALLRSLVEEHVEDVRRAMERIAPGCLAGGDAAGAAHAYLAALREKLTEADPPPAGVFAAIAEDPEFIKPLRDFRAELRALFSHGPNPALAAVVLLACEGLVHVQLTDPQRYADGPPEGLFEMLEALLEQGCGSA